MALKIFKALIQRCELRISAGTWQIAASGPLPLLTVLILVLLWRLL